MNANHDRVMRAARKAGSHAARRHAGGEHVTAPDPLAGSLLARKAATAWHQGFAETRSGNESKAMSGYEDLQPRSGMISLDIPPGVVSPVPGGVDDHHVTVAYLGPDVSDSDYDEACDRAQAVASQMPAPLLATLSGIDSFPPSEPGGKKPVFIPASIPGADKVRGALEDLSVSQFKAWHPHVTLGYSDPDSPLPDPQPDKHVLITHLSVHRGDEVRRFPFGGASGTKQEIPVMLETKTGPRGWSHGWVWHGVPGTGDSVYHPSHGKGVVTAATDKHVTIRYHGSGAVRTYEHSKPALGEAAGFVTRAEHESRQRAAGREAARAASEGPRRQRPFSAGYLRGEGATDADVAELARRYEVMHGKPPTKAQLAKVKRAKPSPPGGSIAREAAAQKPGAAGRRADFKPGEAERVVAQAKAARIHEADKAQGGGHLPPLAVASSAKQADGSHVTHAVDHEGRDYTVTLGADRNVTVTRDGRSLTAPGGANPTQTARELAGKLAAPAPATPAPAHTADEGGKWWADTMPAAKPEPKPVPKQKYEQGGMFAQPDKLGTDAMFGDRWGTSDITAPDPGAVAPTAGNGNAAHAAAARAIAGNVRMEHGLTKGQREEAEQRLYAAARHLDAGNHGEAAAELDAVRHRTGMAGGGVIKGSTAAKAKELAAKIRSEHGIKSLAGAREVKDLAAAITSATGREDTVRRYLAVAEAFLERGDVKAAYGALDLARRYALGEFGDNPDRAVLLGDKTEAWRPILRLRDSLRGQA